MTTLVHISDLHFGRLYAATLEPLLAQIRDIQPAVVAVSGDLTQRARRSQFEAAAAFLKRLPCEHCVVVPGNHDIPLWNAWRRFVNPRRDFFRYVCSERYPVFINDAMAMVGIDTARSFALTGGRVNAAQLARVREIFAAQPADRCRVVVAHHPFVVPEGTPSQQRVGRSEQALSGLLEDHVDLLLTGHRHLSWTSKLGTRLFTVHSGTATSSRTRGEPNAFHEVRISRREFEVWPWHWRDDQGRFMRDQQATRQTRR